MRPPLEALAKIEELIEKYPDLSPNQRGDLQDELERAYYSYTLVDIKQWNAQTLERFAEAHRKLVG